MDDDNGWDDPVKWLSAIEKDKQEQVYDQAFTELMNIVHSKSPHDEQGLNALIIASNMTYHKLKEGI